MAERSNAPPERFTRGRLIVGVVVVLVVAAGAVVGANRLLRPDGAQLAYIRADRLVIGDEARMSLPTEVASPALSPDGRWLAFGEDELVIEPVGGGEQVGPIEGRPVVWTPDGALVIERPGAQDRTFLALFERDATPEPIVPLGLGSHVGRPVWLGPDLFAVALPPRAGGEPALHVISLSGGTPAIEHLVEGAIPLAAAPGGTEMLFVRTGGNVVAAAPDGSGEREVGIAGTFTSAAVSPGGLVALAGRDAGVPGTWVLAAGGGQPLRLAGAPASAMAWLDESSLAVITPARNLIVLSVPEGAETEIARGVMPGFLSVVG